MEGGKLVHSHSQPGGMDRTPPGTPKKGGKMLAVRVQMLDDSITMFQVQAKALGRVLFDQVCKQLHLLESDYFGLEYQEIGGTKYWLDLEKPLSRQIGLSLVDTLVRFCVKFYTPDPSQLEEEFTRYLFCLQIKRDLAQGLLQCNDNTAALMASYIVQAECGDYVVEDYPDHRYLSTFKFVPNQDQELERRIMENHKKHIGQSPAEADLNLLETARRCELYGIKMHPAKDHEGVPLNLAVAHMGIVVFQNCTKINTFSWAKIRKISFKRKRFLVKLHPEGYGCYKDIVEFFFEGRNECKNFWKKCVENHGFFRCSMVKRVPRQKTRVLSRGSSFRYSGRTQKQVVEFVRENYVKRQTFQRSQSFRHSSSAHSSVANVGTSISAHPLLPLGDNAVAGTPASLSCGSMTLTSSPLHAADPLAGGSPSPPLTTSVSPGTSVTSSPQHFYPQETPYRRPGHPHSRLNHPQEHSRHTTSPLQSPTSAATTAAINRSASHSNSNNNNNGNLILDSDLKSSRISLKNPDLMYFNDVYSNLYSSLRNLGYSSENVDKENDTKIETSRHLSNVSSKSNESVQSPTKRPKRTSNKKQEDEEDHTWLRSSSCKNLYQHENADYVSENNNQTKSDNSFGYGEETLFKIGFDSPVTRYDDSRRGCYSAAASKTPSIDRAGDIITDTRIYSSSYPGTTSSLSTESVEGEPMFDVNDSQDEIVLSHDDVSHDSYELLEKELDDFEIVDSSSRTRRNRKYFSDNERARSCSWGSDKGEPKLDSRSSDKIYGQEHKRSRENGFRSLERSKSPKHKSEMDFRSLDRKSPKNAKIHVDGSRPIERKYVADHRRKTREYYNNGTDLRRRSKELDENQKIAERISPLNGRALNVDEKDFHRNYDNEVLYHSGHDLKKRYQERSRSYEESEMFIMDSEQEYMKGLHEKKEMERKREKRGIEDRFHEGIREIEQKDWERRLYERKKLEESRRGDEISSELDHDKCGKKLERVFSNQFGKYPEFLAYTSDYELLKQEKKVSENYEKVCQVGKIAKELERSEKALSERLHSTVPSGKSYTTDPETLRLHKEVMPPEKDANKKPFRVSQFSEYNAKTKGGTVIGFSSSPKTSPKLGKAPVERTKSDPYDSSKNSKRNVLTHQKSIDLITPQDSAEVASDYDNDDSMKKTSRSEHDIPYMLRKRHFMNGTAKEDVLSTAKTGVRSTGILKDKTAPVKSTDTKMKGEERRLNVEIINLDAKEEKDVVTSVQSKRIKPVIAKKPIFNEQKNLPQRVTPKKDTRKIEPPKVTKAVAKDGGGAVKQKDEPKISDDDDEYFDEPIYAQVIKGKVIIDATEAKDAEKVVEGKKKVPPVPPKRTTSVPKSDLKRDDTHPKPPERTSSLTKPSVVAVNKKTPPEPPKRTTSVQNKTPDKSPEEKADVRGAEAETKEIRGGDGGRPVVTESPGATKTKNDFPKSGIVAHKREELFARTRLGLSEGSAFTPISRQGHVDSPSTQRRAKSLDAPVVSVHRLPPADAFSSKDDTVDENEEDIIKLGVVRPSESFKDVQKDKTCKTESMMIDTTVSTESEMDVFLPDDADIDKNFKETIESQLKVELPYTEEKVLDAVRNKRLLSKIDSMDSEGDLDSSRKAEPLPIPSDRLVNLPESVRFPSVRQISGQTSEESADGWEQREVKVKRRTPRRSVGREDQDTGVQESVVWDSKDDEPPDDDVWDSNAVFTLKQNGQIKMDPSGSEYLKRGSCGQSIDDDNVSTPMKESSPEHWVSVDDLPEALEREERLLREQEKILREKILNEKLKRELNLDTVDFDRRYFDSSRQNIDNSGKEKFKGHSLDTYELKEKRLRERGTNKNCSLDEHILRQSPIRNYLSIASDLELSDKSSSYENVPKKAKCQTDYIKCKVVNNVNEIDQFGDNDEELEEFVVVLDEGLGDGKEGREVVWDEISFRRSLSKEESLISVPEEFKDVEEEIPAVESSVGKKASDNSQVQKVEIRLDEEVAMGKDEKLDELTCKAIRKGGEEKSCVEAEGTGRLSPYDDSKTYQEGKRPSTSEEPGRLSPYKDIEERRRLSDDTGRLSPYDSTSRRGSDDPRRGSASDAEAGRLSPYDDSRRGSEDPRRLSTSEDSRHYSMSESVSEETRRRLSSTEETRRKRASLTKQCSVGVDSLSDDMIPGIQECSSSFEQDEKDVFESINEPLPPLPGAVGAEDASDQVNENSDAACEEKSLIRKLEIEVSEDVSDTKDSGIEDEKEDSKETSQINHLAPPAGERELSRETEDSMDYGEGDFKDIRETVKEKDISDGLICDSDSVKSEQQSECLPSSVERSEVSDADDLRFIDDKRGSTPEILVGKSKEAAAVSVVVVNEGISVLNKIVERDRKMKESGRSRTLPKTVGGTGSTSTDSETASDEQRHTLPKVGVKPKPLTPKPDYVHKKLTKAVPNIKYKPVSNAILVETSQESSQDSDVDRLSEVSLLAQIQSQIARRNLADTGKRLRREVMEVQEMMQDPHHQKGYGDDDGSGKEKRIKADEMGKEEKKSPEQEKRDSGEDVSSSSSAPPHPKRELSSTWRPFLLESSGSSSLEEGWLPPDDNAHLADEEETSSNSNNQQDDSIHDDVIDYPTGIGYPVLNLSSAEMMVGGYSSVFALSRTLSRISERSTSEQERSDVEDDVTKPSSHSVSIEEESIISSDHQPSLSSDSASPKAGTSNIPELPDDRSPIPENFLLPEDRTQSSEPFSGVIPPPMTDEDWPSPPSSSSVFDTPVISHVETFYMEIHPEEAYKVVVAEPQNDDNSSSDENQTLQEEGEILHLSSDNLSFSTTTTTQDGTVIIPVHVPNVRTNSVSEDTSIMSTSDWSSSTIVRHRTSSNFGTTEDLSDWTKSSTSQDGKYHSKQIGSSEELSEWSSSTRRQTPSTYSRSDEISSENLGTKTETWQAQRSCDTSQLATVSGWSNSSSSKMSPDERSLQEQESPKPKMSKTRPPKLKSPPSKNMGFFETPISKVRSPTSQIKFFERPEKSHSNMRSPTSRSESASPKNHGRFFENPSGIYHTLMTDYYDLHKTRSSSSHRRHLDGSHEPDRRNVCTPYYSNVAEKAEKSYYGQYDSGSLERTKMQPSRKSISYHSVIRIRPNEDEGSSNDAQSPPPTSNTIPRASKKSRRRHRVALDIQIRDGKMVAPPKTRTTVLDNSDSDRSSPSFSSRRRESEIPKVIPEASVSAAERENNNTILPPPLQNGKTNGEIGNRKDVDYSKSPSVKNHSDEGNPHQTNVLSELSMNDQNQKPSSKINTSDSLIGNNSLDTKLMKTLNRNPYEENATPVPGDLESKRKRFTTDRGYFIAKELLSTERTYTKDLDVINVWFREEVAKTEDEMPDDVLSCLFNLIEPLREAHSRFLLEVEQRLSTWEGRNNSQLKGESQGLGDIILNHFSILPLYMKYLDNHLLILERLDAAFRKNRKFEQLYREFEIQRVCYLPLSSFVLKPLQRLLHYHNLLGRLLKHYGPEHVDHGDCSLAQAKLSPIVENLPSSLKISENFVQLSELQRDMPSFEGLLQGGREFIRQGCLLKHSKKGFQQRMFFLFSDILVYTNRTTTPSLQFKVNGQMPLRGVMVEESEDRVGANHSFIIYGGNRTLTVAASSQEEKDKWLEDMYEAIQNARERNDGKMLQYLSLKSCSSSDEIMDKIGEDNNPNRERNSQQRSNTTVHVCWHRNTSTSLKDHLKALESELSGFLLRKFKNSNGWQKLWVVFTNFCLFFYKTYLDDFPLASLPLLGYTVTVPVEEDNIHKDYVFKLQFKNHVYFFRAESDYTFSRWMEVISSATQHSSRLRLFSRKDS